MERLSIFAWDEIYGYEAPFLFQAWDGALSATSKDDHNRSHRGTEEFSD